MSDPLTQRVLQELAADRIEAAIAAVRLHLRLRPRDATAGKMLGKLLGRSGRIDAAIQQFQSVITAHPRDLEARIELARTLLASGRWQDALSQYESILANDPSCLPAMVDIMVVLPELQQTRRAVEIGRRALQSSPSSPEIAINLSRALLRMGESEQAVDVLRASAEANPEEVALRSHLLFAMSNAALPAMAFAEAHREFGRRIGTAASPARTDPDPDRPIRIGVLSSDLRDHSVAFFLDAIVSNSPTTVTLEAFSTAGSVGPDPMQSRLREKFAAWHACGYMSDEALASLIRSRGVDVLLDLSGHTGGHRLGAIASKPAPVMISAIGYPDTTGLPAMDWRIVDSITDPPGSEALATERLLRLDPCFLCYTPPAQAPEPSMPPPKAPLTFGSFNNAAKIGRNCIDLWSEVLRNAPTSRLLLKSQTLSDTAGRERLERLFERAGVSPDRLELMAYSSSREAHLAVYGRVHVALDTTPYNGTTTTCEALWMGVPVITMPGDRHASRVSASLLTAAGHPEWIARDPADFVRVATTLAADHERLRSLRATLRDEVAGSILCDATAYGDRFHRAMRACWRAWCERQARA